MDSKILRTTLGVLTACLVACSSETKPPNVTPSKNTPEPKVTSDCPAHYLSKYRFQIFMDEVKSVHNPDVLGPTPIEVRAGYLAAQLATRGVPTDVILNSFRNGKFAAMVSWLPDYIEVVDSDKFYNCEEN